MTELNETNIMAYAQKSPLLLIDSAKRNSVGSLEYLINNGYDLSFVDINSNTILHHIVAMSIPEKEIIGLIETIVKKTDETLLDAKNDEGLTVLELAAKLECKEVYSHLLLRNKNLHRAVRNGDSDKVKLLLENGADVNEEDGNTPLHIAVYKNNIEMAKLLIENKADVNNKEDKYGYTPLHIAAYKNNIEMAKLLVENNSVSQAKADVNGKENKYGYTPLHTAVHKNNIEMVKFLVENKADIEKENNYGDTPLLWCVYKNYDIEIVKLLVENGANVNHRNKKGETPLHWAVQHSVDVTKLLLENGANVNHKDTMGHTPLSKATEWKNIETMKLLLEHGGTF